MVKLTDAESIEAQVVENLQREDIHPLEESLGFKSLLQLGEPTYTIASIAARAGKSEAYVQGRIKLADLIPSVAEAFLKDTIAIGHALLIAKLPDSQQQEAFNAAFRGMWTTDGNSQVLIPVRELAAWIESNILLQLASAPFDKQDEALVPAAGSCSNCPKRTGYNKLLFADVRKDSCTDPQCFRAKIDAHVSKTLETKPQLVQISSAWNTREGAPLGKNRYVELEIKKAKTNGTGSKVAPQQKPCQKMTEAVVMDGGRRGELVKVCADPSCRVHHPDTPSPEQVAKERAEERKRIEKSKQAITIRHCVLAKVLERVAAPLKKADLLTVAQYTIGHLSYNQVPVLAKRHKVDTAKTTKPPQEVLMKKISTYDEAALSRLSARNQLARLGLSAGRRIARPAHGCRQAFSGGCRKSRESSGGGVRREAQQTTKSQDKTETQVCGLSKCCKTLAGRSKRPAFFVSRTRRQRCQSATLRIAP